jgi:lipoprotein NlpD
MKKISCMISLIVLTCFTGCASNGDAPINNVWDEVHTTQTRYTVQPGDTVYSVAWRFNLDEQKLVSWNHLEKPYALRLGQILRLDAPPADGLKQNVTHVVPIPQPLQFVPRTSSAPTKKINRTHEPAQVKVDPVSSAQDETPQNNPVSKTNAVLGKSGWPWPVKGKLLNVYGRQGNKGIDIAVPEGTEVKAVQAGTVVYSGANLHGYGQLIIIKQKNNLITAYAHNSKLLVSEGVTVTAGQVIALSGSSEASQPMLHFEVRQLGKTVDPIQYLS